MRRPFPALVLALSILLSGCYHAVVNTGRTPSSTVIQQQWAKSFVYGLVPPDPVATSETCPAGVARVETRHSFLNGLVGGLTWGIFTPMEITVTCAAGGMDDAPDADAPGDEETEAGAPAP